MFSQKTKSKKTLTKKTTKKTTKIHPKIHSKIAPKKSPHQIQTKPFLNKLFPSFFGKKTPSPPDNTLENIPKSSTIKSKPSSMGQVLSQVDQCFQNEAKKFKQQGQNDTSSIPAAAAAPSSKPTKSSDAPKVATPAAQPKVTPPAAAATPAAPAAAPKVEEKKTEAVSPAAAPVATSDDLPPYTNRPEDLTPYPTATGSFVKRTYTTGEIIDLSSYKLTGEFVTDGKVSFDKVALTIPGVFPTRDEEVAQLQKAIDIKADAGAATAEANKLHEEHNKLYEAGDKDGARAKLEESKVFREKAKKIHEESFDLAYAGAMSMAIKAVFSKYPSIDYHVFLQEPYQQSYTVAIQMMQKFGKFGRKDFLVIPGEGSHSAKDKGPQIRPHFEKWMADNKITNEQITSGSYSIILADCKF